MGAFDVGDLGFAFVFGGFGFAVGVAGGLVPAVGADEVEVVLEGFVPVVKQVLVDGVGFGERPVGVGGEQVFADVIEQYFGLIPHCPFIQFIAPAAAPGHEYLAHALPKALELRVGQDGGTELATVGFKLKVAGAMGFE